MVWVWRPGCRVWGLGLKVYRNELAPLLGVGIEHLLVALELFLPLLPLLVQPVDLRGGVRDKFSTIKNQ